MTIVNNEPRTILKGGRQHILAVHSDWKGDAYAYLYASCKEPNQLMTLNYFHR